ncbi:MAG: DUF2304 domain-containing protein [Myxococcales bacterium]|nr:DUF2304 domain-containing protein [Myxococcales bacterium]
MNTFQILSLLTLGALAAISISNIVLRRGRLRFSLMWLAVWVGAGAAIARPDLAVIAARLVGIGRGADLVFYCNVLLTLAGFFYFYLRNRQTQRQLTVMVREVALLHATSPQRDPGPST